MGEKTVAGFTANFLEYGRLGRRKLPRVLRALRGWRRLAPGRPRKPPPWPVVAAIATRLLTRGRLDMCAWGLSAFQTYLRPKEVVGWQRQDPIVPVLGITGRWSITVGPEERPEGTNVGAAVDSLRLGSRGLRWKRPVWAALASGDPEESLRRFLYRDLSKNIGEVMKELGVTAVPPQLRCSGPAWDRTRGLRSLMKVQKCGLGAAPAGGRRYERHARGAAKMASLGPSLEGCRRTCAGLREECVRHGAPAPPRPRM